MTIENTFRSVARQNHRNLEYILVDGGSSDETLSIAQRYGNVLSKVISEPDEGIYDAMNKGLKTATGDIIGILNSDDFFIKDTVLKYVEELFDANPEIDLVTGAVDFVSSEDIETPIRTYYLGNFKPWMLRFGLVPPHPAIFVRKSLYEKVGKFNLKFKIAADFDLLTRAFLTHEAKYKIVNEKWVRMRIGGVSTNGLKANIYSTLEMKKSLASNGVYSNLFFLLLRLPIKFITQIWLPSAKSK